MDIKKIFSPILGIVLLLGVIGAIFISNKHKSAQDSADAISASIINVRGMIGSEKESFFTDPAVSALLLKKGFKVTFDKVGSRESASRDQAGYDFGFPAGAPAAIALQKKAKAKQVYPTFYTPMAVASWKILIPTLEAEGIIKLVDGAYYIIDMKKLMDKIRDGSRWRDMKGNVVYQTGKSVLINSTDVRKSNSAMMYLALASYISNNSEVVDNETQMNKVLPFVTTLFMRQGLQESSSAGPFEDYVTMGVGKSPLVMIYESQFLEYQSKRTHPNQDMVLLYPQPTIYTKHIVVPFTENGRKFGELLATDIDLQREAAKFGYRTASPEYFTAFLKDKKLSVPSMLVDVIDPPSIEILEKMIQSIETKF